MITAPQYKFIFPRIRYGLFVGGLVHNTDFFLKQTILVLHEPKSYSPQNDGHSSLIDSFKLQSLTFLITVVTAENFPSCMRMEAYTCPF
jgi:hypothetical protein